MDIVIPPESVSRISRGSADDPQIVDMAHFLQIVDTTNALQGWDIGIAWMRKRSGHSAASPGWGWMIWKCSDQTCRGGLLWNIMVSQSGTSWWVTVLLLSIILMFEDLRLHWFSEGPPVLGKRICNAFAMGYPAPFSPPVNWSSGIVEWLTLATYLTPLIYQQEKTPPIRNHLEFRIIHNTSGLKHKMLYGNIFHQDLWGSSWRLDRPYSSHTCAHG